MLPAHPAETHGSAMAHAAPWLHRSDGASQSHVVARAGNQLNYAVRAGYSPLVGLVCE